jgi:hypothetical protein
LRKTVLSDDEIDLTRRFVVFDGFRYWLGSFFGRLVLGWWRIDGSARWWKSALGVQDGLEVI